MGRPKSGLRQRLRAERRALEAAITPGVWVHRMRTEEGKKVDRYGLVKRIDGEGAERVVVWADARFIDGSRAMRISTALHYLMDSVQKIVEPADLPWLKASAEAAQAPADGTMAQLVEDVDTFFQGVSARLAAVEARLQAMSSLRLSPEQMTSLTSLTSDVIGGVTKNLRREVMDTLEASIKKYVQHSIVGG